MSLFTALACLAYLAWLVLEARLARKHRSRLRHVIHVNGIRGKSSVSRLIDAGLRAGGFRVMTKTTGTCPAVIRVDGQETPLRRHGKPSIKEQLKILRMAASQNAEILVVECMAVLPEYQKISEDKMLRSDIGVITNVRLDHLEEMGATLDEIAAALSNTVPRGGALFLGESSYLDFFAAKARDKNTRVIAPDSATLEDQDIDFAENISLALAVCGNLGVDRATALKAMRQYRRDPGSFSIETATDARSGRSLTFINALAANDPASSERILEKVETQALMTKGQKILLINNRHDRPARLLQFVEFAVKHEGRFDRIAAAGDCRPLMRRELIKRGIAPERILSLANFAQLSASEVDTAVFAVGNIVGTGKDKAGTPRITESSHVG